MNKEIYDKNKLLQQILNCINNTNDINKGEINKIRGLWVGKNIYE